MIDISDLFINFQKLLLSYAKALKTIGLFKGSDEWEELTECAFDILITNYLREKYNLSIVYKYETWEIQNIINNYVVKVNLNAHILKGKKNNNYNGDIVFDEIECIDNPVEFYFIEFGNHTLHDSDINSLNYVMGYDLNGYVICANKDDCQFYLKSN